PFQSRTLIGVLVSLEKKSELPYEKLKRAHAILDDAPIFPEAVQKLTEWTAGYYHAGLGEVYAAALPVALRKGEALSVKPEKKKALPPKDTVPVLNADQAKAVASITDALGRFQPFLLDGVTGSGKTEVYLRVIETCLAQSQQVLVLVPEISLTPQTVDRFRARFQVAVVALHSGLSDSARLRGWLAAKSGEASIVIGTRSAIFTPFKHLGLIIVDEEHDGSFKQHDRFRYHARDVAVMRAHQANIPIVLGSATPSLESYLNVERGRYQHLILSERAGNAALPAYQLIDVRHQYTEDGLSPRLKSAMESVLSHGHQVMLFLNRRGFSPVFYCESCGWMAGCDRCDARMVYHRSPERLHCHHCDTRRPIPVSCAECKANTVKPIGLGTQRLEESLAQHFPSVPIIRVDRDSTRKKGAMEALLNEVHAHPSAILLGTQMLAKGHHFPNVTLVGVVDADSGLFSADFRSAENMGQLLMQVAGRAGRADKPGTVLIQTRYPDHPWLMALLQSGYRAFALNLLLEREGAALPPYAYLATLKAEAYTEKVAVQFLEKIKAAARDLSEVFVLGPLPLTLAKRKGLHGQQLLIKANRRACLHAYLDALLAKLQLDFGSTRVKWALDIDPLQVS
ncbi:MAG TPA: primosomal protein N', partial [Gammaproteobacteria bacterium]|nr:primosomal protein N' [Gammaproteobacteria bacterium]